MVIVMMNQEQLKKLISYNHKTGSFVWLERFGDDLGGFTGFNKRYAGKPAGHIGDSRGKLYHRITMHGVRYHAHRLAFLYMENISIPDDLEVDHINGDSLDNRYCNLRIVTHKENGKNGLLRSTNTSGHLGVGWHEATSKWRAKICVDGKTVSLGLHKTKKQASKAVEKAKLKYGFHKNHGRSV